MFYRKNPFSPVGSRLLPTCSMITEGYAPKYRKFAKRAAQRNFLSFTNASVNYFNASHNTFHNSPNAFSYISCEENVPDTVDKTFIVTRQFVATVLCIAEKQRDQQPRERLVDLVTQEIVQYSSDSRSSSDSSNQEDLSICRSDSPWSVLAQKNGEHGRTLASSGDLGGGVSDGGGGRFELKKRKEKRKREMSGCSLSDFIRAYLTREERQSIRNVQDATDREFVGILCTSHRSDLPSIFLLSSINFRDRN